MYRFLSLQEISIKQLVSCLNSAFADYEQPICFTPESLEYYLTASAVDLSLSYGAFVNEQPIGIILNSTGVYHGEQVVFDAGTGIVPAHRGQKVFSMLFDFTVEQLHQRGITKYYLEVLQSNKRAVSIYTKKEFSVRRAYSVLTASGAEPGRKEDVPIIAYEAFRAFPTTFSVEPSFEHTSYNIEQNPHLYEVICLDGKAYCIYAKRNGQLIQMHYNDLSALKDVISALLQRYPRAMAKNVDCDCMDVIQLLTELGFVEILKQYEMVRDIVPVK